MYLCIVRHGQSSYNEKNMFTGWTDVSLTDKGAKEAKSAGSRLKEKNITFDIAYTSSLRRAYYTLVFILKELGQNIEIVKDYRLNERCYGALEGKNKTELGLEYGKEQIQKWRRGYEDIPPKMERTDERFAGNDPMYANINKENLPLSESLEDTEKRVVDIYNEKIVPDLNLGKNVLVVAHGNSLRALVKHLENINDRAIETLEIPTGEPIIYCLDSNLNIISKEENV